MPEPIRVVLTDLDSTVANTEGRAHLAVPGAPRHEDWIAYSRACVNDEPIAGTVRTLQLLAASGLPIFIVSGRNVEAVQQTQEWLARHNVPFDHLRLRKPDDIQDNAEYKAAWVRELRQNGFDPVLMLEDHIGVAKLVEAEGVPVLTVRPWYEDTVGVRVSSMENRETTVSA
jgi:hypothetical protein